MKKKKFSEKEIEDLKKIIKDFTGKNLDVLNFAQYTNKKFFFNLIIEHLKIYGSILFSYNSSEGTVHNIFISKNFKQIGLLGFGGNSKGRLIVGVMFKGFFFFSLKEETSSSYVEEKLKVSLEDAKGIAKLINIIREGLKETNKKKNQESNEDFLKRIEEENKIFDKIIYIM